MNVDNRIESLTPEAQIVCRRWLNVIKILDIDARIIETLRSAERQAELVKDGASSTLHSKHLLGLAWDYAVYNADVYITDGADWRYQLCGLVGKALGCRWPIHLASGAVDADHLHLEESR